MAPRHPRAQVGYMVYLSWPLSMLYVVAVAGFVAFSRGFGALMRRLQKRIQGQRPPPLPCCSISNISFHWGRDG